MLLLLQTWAFLPFLRVRQHSSFCALNDQSLCPLADPHLGVAVDVDALTDFSHQVPLVRSEPFRVKPVGQETETSRAVRDVDGNKSAELAEPGDRKGR